MIKDFRLDDDYLATYDHEETYVDHHPCCTTGQDRWCNCPVVTHTVISGVVKFRALVNGEKATALCVCDPSAVEDEEIRQMLADEAMEVFREMEARAAPLDETVQLNPLYWPPKGT